MILWNNDFEIIGYNPRGITVIIRLFSEEIGQSEVITKNFVTFLKLFRNTLGASEN